MKETYLRVGGGEAIPRYAGMVHFSVNSGALDEAAQAWREGAPPAAEGQPDYKGAMLLVEPAKSTIVGIGLWENKSDADA